MIVKLLNDDPLFKLKKNDLFEAKIADYDPEKVLLKFRISDGFIPHCSQYKYNVKVISNDEAIQEINSQKTCISDKQAQAIQNFGEQHHLFHSKEMKQWRKKQKALIKFARATLKTLENDQEWTGDTIDAIGSYAIDCGLAYVDKDDSLLKIKK